MFYPPQQQCLPVHFLGTALSIPLTVLLAIEKFRSHRAQRCKNIKYIFVLYLEGFCNRRFRNNCKMFHIILFTQRLYQKSSTWKKSCHYLCWGHLFPKGAQTFFLCDILQSKSFQGLNIGMLALLLFWPLLQFYWGFILYTVKQP